ncbi:MAG: methionyl-tRNA formyltransferase [Gammaproteobacteria bacterium]|nr:MAG: methionyl-tRNA formyltransferase [Gammaproteobacteria bacterium]
MKFGFVTCVQLGKSCMEAIYEVGGHLDLVITLNDSQAVNKSGRVYLDEFCSANNIKLLKSSHINNDECIDAIKNHDLDWLFIIGWSQIANKNLLSTPNKGVLGIHPTLLPKGRGRASIPWAIIKNLDETGVTLFKLDEGVDTGDIVDQLVIPLNNDTTATDLYQLVDDAHITLIKDVFGKLENDSVMLKKQDHSLATEWLGRGPADGEIDLKGSVLDADRLIRAVTKPYPGAFYMENNKKHIVWSATILKSTNSSLGKIIEFADGKLGLNEYEIIDIQ